MPECRKIEGTPIFDGQAAMRGFALNAMCYSFNDAANRAAFLADEAGYCARYSLSDGQRAAVAARDIPAMIAQGGNIYYLSKTPTGNRSSTASRPSTAGLKRSGRPRR